MRITSVISHMLATLLLLAGLTALPAAHAADKQGVVIQMSDSDPAKWNLALNNAKNVINAMGGPEKVDVEVVAYGPGINMVKDDSEVGNRLAALAKEGVAFRACGNTMKAMKLTDKDLNQNVKVVPAGVIEIMAKQREGWSYIKP